MGYASLVMKTEQISDSVKIFRLMPFFLGLAIIWSIGAVIYADEIQYIIDKPSEKWHLVAYFLGFYAGNGIPRFIIYGFCICYIKYNYDKFSGSFDDISFRAIFLAIIPISLVYSLHDSKDENYTFWTGYEFTLWMAYILLILLEFVLYKNYLTKKPVTEEKE